MEELEREEIMESNQIPQFQGWLCHHLSLCVILGKSLACPAQACDPVSKRRDPRAPGLYVVFNYDILYIFGYLKHSSERLGL